MSDNGGQTDLALNSQEPGDRAMVRIGIVGVGFMGMKPCRTHSFFI
jgi:hypothetical protein